MVPQRQVFRVCASNLALDKSLGHQHMGVVYHRGRIPSHQPWSSAYGGCAHIRLREPGKSEDKADTAYYLLHSLVEHSCINPKSLSFGYLDEKAIDTDLMKFLGLCPSALSWYLEFASAFSTSSAPFRPMLFLYESKGSMTPQKSHHYVPWCCQAHGPTISCLASASLPSRW
ncbi:hypothetical protein B296_00026991 [Ensete ventricosum]|uniref:Uncharacterized protein n=1 Tax=Ensete ventricosum TaxID=4639 RepID=A0A427AAG6_ENSVE|nr:hypothetical protein B296_00026991 [Ensete ventricosum]